MQYWLQQLQQKRWEFSNTRGCGNRDSLCSPTPLFPHTGLVAKDAGKNLSRVGRLCTHILFMTTCGIAPAFLVLLNSVPHCQDVLNGCCSMWECLRLLPSSVYISHSWFLIWDRTFWLKWTSCSCVACLIFLTKVWGSAQLLIIVCSLKHLNAKHGCFCNIVSNSGQLSRATRTVSEASETRHAVIEMSFYRSTNCVHCAADVMPSEMPNETMESVRNDFTEEADANGLVGLHTARNPTTYNFSFKSLGTELR